MMVMNKELKEVNRKGLQRSMVVVMAGDDGDEQRTERTERTEGLQRTIFHLCTQNPPPNAAILAQDQQYFWAACR